MNAGLRALLTGLIDYAGLFPPAKLPMAESVRNYLRYRDEPEGWMLGRFICPAARLGELAEFHDEIPAGRPVVVSVIGRSGATAEEYLRNLKADVADMTKRRGERLVLDVMELRPPPEFVRRQHGREHLSEFAIATPEVAIYYELPADDPELDVLLAVLALVEQLDRPPGFKLRCGGLEASAFPSSAKIAAALNACLYTDVPFKATAGLHHPFPRFDQGVQARMHGFVNLFAAGVLAPDAGTIAKILDDDDPANFRFDDSGMSWGSLSATVEQIRRARERSVISFGSCSFDEPRDDLRALGWL